MTAPTTDKIGREIDYTSIATSYDANRFCDKKGLLVDELDRNIIRRLVQRTNARRILDAPTGTGRVITYLRDLPVELTACDLTPAMLEHAETKTHGHAVDFIQANIADIPRESASFDCIVCLRFFHLFAPSERPPFVAEFDRLLRPGGFLICSFTNGWYGGGIGWAKKSLGIRTMQFLYPGEIGRLFPHWQVREMCGNFFPLHWLLARCGFNPFLKTLSRMPPFRRLCWETFFLLQKPV